MRKEVLLAIIIGVILGAVILYGLKIANESATPATPEETQTSQTITTPTPTPTNTLTIDNPTDHFVSFEKNLTLTGRATPQTNLAITSEGADDIVTADDSGKFTSELSLVLGENPITISAFFPDGTQTVQTLNVIYTTSTIAN